MSMTPAVMRRCFLAATATLCLLSCLAHANSLAGMGAAGAASGSDTLPVCQNGAPSCGTTTPLLRSTLDQLRGAYVIKCGGVDDTAAIAAEVTAANNNAGGRVQFPASTCVTNASIPIYSNLTYAGVGSASIVLLKSFANVPVFLGNGFAGLTGTNSTFGIHDFTIRDLTIDGNISFNTGADCVQLYGFHYRIEDVNFQNCPQDGIYSEWSNSASCPPGAPQCMEATLAHLRGSQYGHYGINWQGPHDSIFEDITAYTFIAGTGQRAFSFGSPGTASQWNGMLLTSLHGWGSNAYGMWIENGGGMSCANCEMEGATVAQVMNGSNEVRFANFHLFNCGNTTVPGYIAGTTLTLTGSPSAGVVEIGQQVTATGVTAGTVITAGSGSSWTVKNSQTVGSSGSPVTFTMMAAGLELGNVNHTAGNFVVSPGLLLEIDCWIDFRYDQGGDNIQGNLNLTGYPASELAYVGNTPASDILEIFNQGSGPFVNAGCGSGGSIGSNSNILAGNVAIGTGATTSCSIGFSLNSAFPVNRPLMCAVTPMTSAAPAPALNGAPAPTGFTFTTASSMASDTYGWICR